MSGTFRPRRVLAVDLATGELEHPDPARRSEHPDARVLVRWHGEPVGVLDLAVPDEDVVATAAREAPVVLAGRLAAVTAAPGADADGEPPLVTVSIASFRNVAPTVACVRRVLEVDWSPLEVVVVDNDADPGPLGEALTAAFGGDDRVRWVHEPRQGLSYARNAGLAAARGSVVAFTDDDVLVDRLWVRRLVGGFAADPDVACVTGAILPVELETQAQTWLEEYGGFHKGFERQLFDLRAHRRDTPLYPFDAGQFGSGANVAFRTDVLRAMGGFSVDLGAGTPAHGGEDLDVLQRTVSAGHTLVYEPAALLWHAHRRSEEALRRQLFRYGVGLSATVTRWLLQDRRTAAAVLRRVPAGVAHVLAPGSRKNEGKTAGFPPLLTLLELLGLVCGPVAYLRSRRRSRRLG